MCKIRFYGVLVLLSCIADSLQHREEFHEELYVHTLPSGHVNTYFQFTTRWHYGAQRDLHHTRLIPRPIAEILLQYDVKELHIGLTQGNWHYQDWGYPVVDAAAGAEVWAWFAAPNLTESNVDEQWTTLAGTFSGILCASLNFIDNTNSIAPKYGFRPQFMAGKPKDNDELRQYVRYASLPREIVCTENLTPWKKLLPCNNKYGFASLLNSGHVHNTNYHSLGIKLRTICETYSDNCMLEFTETANLVYDPKLLGTDDFSLRRLFGQGLNGYCVLADSSKIYVQVDDDEARQRFTLNPLPSYNISSLRGGVRTKYGVYDIQRQMEEKLFNIAWLHRKPQTSVPLTPAPPIFAHRYILGHGQEKGKIITQVTNTHYAALPVILQEHIPWFVPSYIHTLQLTVVSQPNEPAVKPRALHYVPGVQRVRPYQLEVAFEVPALSTVQIAFDFDYIFLKWLEYPPDANHGHYLGSAVLFTLLPVARNYTAVPVEGFLFAHAFNASRDSYLLALRTEALLLSLPTPDFSMPYNVICLACTVVALAFGPIHSVATKRIVIEQQDAEPQTFTAKLKKKIFGKKRTKQTDQGDTTATRTTTENTNK